VFRRQIFTIRQEEPKQKMWGVVWLEAFPKNLAGKENGLENSPRRKYCGT